MKLAVTKHVQFYGINHHHYHHLFSFRGSVQDYKCKVRRLVSLLRYIHTMLSEKWDSWLKSCNGHTRARARTHTHTHTHIARSSPNRFVLHSV